MECLDIDLETELNKQGIGAWGRRESRAEKYMRIKVKRNRRINHFENASIIDFDYPEHIRILKGKFRSFRGKM